ncbi:catechol 2,3-dioxygenase-like lactoylglutathione lyase family enzyme [Gordonia amarae]|uniref:Glyoxalase-like domain-containing protein n=2 Tax=Gordonia amarae TaxID=36821 RepID=G7GUI7_9ACTN|nr:VOC family protein [Gordonia amarae]MCS3877392.1 catechol 2,3-dioxygenase-like lactoylglutathione lyase family enzyme [Gordonia amarae]GAB07262.1 hypothetical protein GOAMR_63_01090 [Gordonia amarae NBRC 15530]
MLELTDPEQKIQADDVRRTAEFWSAALGLSVSEAGDGAAALFDERHTVRMTVYPEQVGRQTLSKDTPIELRAYDTQDVVAAVERLTALGAGPLVGDSYPAHPGHASLTDPAGNVVSIRSALPAKPQ